MKAIVCLLMALTLLSACAGENTTTTVSSSPPLAIVLSKQAAALPAALPSATQQTEVLQLVQAMFNAAPGADYLGQFAGLVAGGLSLPGLADALADTEVFQIPSLYPLTLTNQQFAERFVNNLVGTTVSEPNKEWAIGWITDQLNTGTTRGAAIWTAVSALTSIPVSNPDWGTAVTLLNNKVTVAAYYSITRAISSADLAALQAVTASVTSASSTVTSALAALDTGYPAGTKILLASSGASQDLAYSPANYLISIETADSIGAQLVDYNGNPVGSYISTGRTGVATSAAFDGTNYLLVWEDALSGNGQTGWQIYGQFISTTGQMVGVPFAICSTGVWFDGLKAVTYANGRYLVTYTRLINPALGDSSTNRYIAGQLVAPGGSLVGSELRISDGYGAGSSVGTDGSNFIVAWHEDRYDSEIRARIIAITGTMGTEFSVNASSYPSDNPIAITFDGTNYLMVWSEEVISQKWQVYGQRMSTSGILVGSPIAITADNNLDQMATSVTCGGSSCLVSWVDRTTTADWNLYGQYLTLDGTLSGGRFVINAEALNQTGGVGYANGSYRAIINSGVVLGESGFTTFGMIYSAAITP